MRKVFFITLTVLLVAAFAVAQQPAPGPISNGAPVTVTQPGIVTNETGAGYYNGTSTSGLNTGTGQTLNVSGTVGSQGNSAPAAGAGLTPAYTGNVIGVLDYIPNYDVMGAHENGGRGCAGCHAPHNQARGNGGNGKGGGYGAYADVQGGLWGEDTSNILTAYAGGITFNGGASHHSGQLYWGVSSTSTSSCTVTAGVNSCMPLGTGGATGPWTDATYTGVATCLSCHDGNVSVGAMMSGVSYEQTFGLLNGVGIGLNSTRAAVALYGSNPIPTFLGVTATTPNGYASTHPVGQTANAGAALGSVLTTASYGLQPATTTNKLNIALIPANTPYGNFVASYSPGALASLVAKDASFADNFVVCTTCHNQHNMAVWTGVRGGPGLPAGVTQVRTIFFVNGGYNPGAPYDPTHEPSTMRFCQQCHFSFSSEYFGASNIGTAY